VKTVVRGLYTFTGLLVGRVYLIDDGDDGLTIIDAGLGSAPAKIVNQLRGSGFSPGDVKRIVITHAHPDHVFGLPALQAETGAAVICHAVEQPYVEGRAKILRKGGVEGDLIPGTPVTRAVVDGDILPIMGGTHVLFTPGHSPGHLSLWQPDKGILICGDVFMNLVGFTLPFDAFTVDMAQVRRSVIRLADLKPSVICAGHGPVVTENAAIRLQKFAAKCQ